MPPAAKRTTERPAARARYATGRGRSMTGTMHGSGSGTRDRKAGNRARGLSPLQQEAAAAIVNVFETGSVSGDYNRVTLLAGDRGRLSYGRSQAALASGALHALVEAYCAQPDAQLGESLVPFLRPLAARSRRLDRDRHFHNLLRAAADDPRMRAAQDGFFARHYWTPAVTRAHRRGIETALGTSVVYDSLVHGAWDRIAARTTRAVGAARRIGERRWIRGYVETRRRWLARHRIDLLHATVYRMDAFLGLIALGNWTLGLPIAVRGIEISAATLAARPAGCYDGPAPGTRTLEVTTPLLRGRDVRRLQLGLSAAGIAVIADGIFGPATARALASYQARRGVARTGRATPESIAELTA